MKVDSMKEGQNFTVQIQYTQTSGTPKSRLQSKGTLYISGEMTEDRPSFRFMLEKSDEITDHDIAAFVECYRYILFVLRYKERPINQPPSSGNRYR